jgi:hypothetical protein
LKAFGVISIVNAPRYLPAFDIAANLVFVISLLLYAAATMAHSASPNTTPALRGLATIALLKARFDENVDHIDMFMPLVIDTVSEMQSSRFNAEQVGDELRQRHGISIPPPTVKTLLQRAVHRHVLQREHGLFLRPATFERPDGVLQKKNEFLGGYQRLATAFRSYAAGEATKLHSNEEALTLILRFLEDNQVDLLLDVPVRLASQLSTKESRLVAHFCQSVIAGNADLAGVLKSIMEGLVLSNAAFLRDIADRKRQFRDLDIYLDSHIVRRALGYEGGVQERVTRETLEVLTRANARCRVFEKTVDEIRGILLMFERKLATPEGKKSMHATDMDRHFLRLRPSDAAEMNALLEVEIRRIGLKIVPTPAHIAGYTLDEKTLQQALADEKTGDDTSPRVLHDVDCVASILTMRRGRVSDRIDDTKSIFATVGGKVLQNIKTWYAAQGGRGIAPAIHIRALTNLAWLRCPMLLGDLKLHELVALCAAALQPSRGTWDRFRKHLDELKTKGHLTSDEAMAVVASQLTERLLADADESSEEPDASTLDEIVERVKESYQAAARHTIADHAARTKEEIEAARSAAQDEFDALAENARDARSAADEHEKRWLDVRTAVSLRAQKQARLVSRITFSAVALMVLGGAGLLFVSHEWHRTVFGVLAGVAIGTFLVLEVVGVLNHASELRDRFHSFLMRRLYSRAAKTLGLPASDGFDQTKQ